MAGTEFVFRIKGDASGAVQASNEAGRAIGGVKKETDTMNNALAKMGTLVAGAFALGEIIAFGKEVAKVTGQMQSLQVRMEGIYGTAQAGNKALDSLRRTADELGLNFADLSENFVQFVSAAKASGMEVSKAEKIFKNMSVAIAGSGASTEQAGRAMTALTQMIGKGKISAEEMRGQLGEALPQAMGWLAKSMNKTVAEVGKLMDSGQLTTDVLEKFSKTAAEAMGPNVQGLAKSLNAEMNRLENSWTSFMQSVGQSGAIEVAVSSLSALVKTLDKAAYSMNLLVAASTGNMTKVAQIVAGTYSKSLNEFEVKAVDAAQKQVQAYIKLKGESKDLQAQLIKEAESHERVARQTEQVAKVIGKQDELDTVTIINEKAKAAAFREAAAALNEQNTVSNVAVPLTKEQIAATEREAKAQKDKADSTAKATAELRKQMIESAKKLKTSDFEMGPQMTPDYKKAVEDKAKVEKEFYDYIDQLEVNSNQHAMELADQRKEKEVQDAKDIKDLQKEKLKYGMDAAMQLTGLITAGYEKQAAILNQSLQRGAISQEQYDKKIRDIKRKEFISNKVAALAQIAISTAVNASAQPELLPFILANGAVQAAVVAAQPIPYAKGTKKVPMVRGAVRGQDSVHAILMPDERVVPASTNMTPGYNELLNDIQDRRISPDMAMFLHEMSAGRMVASGGRGLDEERLGDILSRAISRIPSPSFNIDERGVAVISQRAQFREQQIRRKL